MSACDDPVLSTELLRAMLGDVAPRSPGAFAAARIKRDVLRRARQPHAVRREDGWRRFFGNTEMKILCDDGAYRACLVRMVPGSRLPAHTHEDSDEECVVLEGEVWVDGRRYGPGDYQLALRGSEHRSVHSVTGALFYFRSATRPPCGAG